MAKKASEKRAEAIAKHRQGRTSGEIFMDSVKGYVKAKGYEARVRSKIANETGVMGTKFKGKK